MHYHWLVWAHNGQQTGTMPGQGMVYVDVVDIEVLAVDEVDALKMAERLAPGRRGYLLKRVSEHEEHK